MGSPQCHKRRGPRRGHRFSFSLTGDDSSAPRPLWHDAFSGADYAFDSANGQGKPIDLLAQMTALAETYLFTELLVLEALER